jgi:hypothetical protein
MDLVKIFVAKREGWIWVRKLILSKSVNRIIYLSGDFALKCLVINPLGVIKNYEEIYKRDR